MNNGIYLLDSLSCFWIFGMVCFAKMWSLTSCLNIMHNTKSIATFFPFFLSTSTFGPFQYIVLFVRYCPDYATEAVNKCHPSSGSSTEMLWLCQPFSERAMRVRQVLLTHEGSLPANSHLCWDRALTLIGLLSTFLWTDFSPATGPCSLADLIDLHSLGAGKSYCSVCA